MSPSQEQLKKYASLAIRIGVNIQKGQPLLINAPIEGAEFVHYVVEEAYNAGAENVQVEWNDEVLTRMKFMKEPLHVLESFPEWKVQRLTEHVNKGGAVITIYSPNPELLQGVDPAKFSAANKASGEALKDYRNAMMTDTVQWSIIGIPTTNWAKKVYPNVDVEEAKQQMWEQIFHITRVDQEDPIQAWLQHNDTLRQAREYLNEKQYAKLIYKAPGTDLTVELPENHRWAGGSTVAKNGATFNPNLPTEEVFTMPHKDGVNGTVKSTKPLNFNGNLIDNFTLTFKDGKVVDFEAETGYETLKYLLEADESSNQLGELALVPHSSPISQSNLIFYNTLYDENASSHLALGAAYPINMKDGSSLTEDELKERGANVSITHEDFMIGSAELDIDAVTKEGNIEPIFRNGNWALDFSSVE
ncbi:aminopeptidase [Salirhabdus salicampi]|nr:aminopeptidase [Salirhabdus salicampi]